MDQNEPNPFVNETIINYTITENSTSAYLVIYDLAGKQLTSFLLQKREAHRSK